MLKLSNTLRNIRNISGYFFGKQFEEAKWGYTYQQYRRKYTISPTFYFAGPGILLLGDGKMIFQGNSTIGRYSTVHASSNSRVEIGKNCAIAYFVSLIASSNIADQDFSKTNIWKRDSVLSKDKTIQIGDDCWIGSHVFINPGVTIGNNAVVGANSVVTKNIPSHSISVGAPARVIRFKSYLDEQVMLELAKNNWSSLSLKLKKQLKQQYKIRVIPP
ncbi:MAG TPA: acyltransferase [Anaerovoracaceae bacterium]|nr:acyltransferase [Anaerovoracaceae bacterium]